MNRHTRNQGAILQDHKLLLIRHRELKTGHEYWVIPGGGKEPGESEEACIIREMKEETQLEVAVERLLFEEATPEGDAYKWRKIYLCRPIAGVAKPGYEPEQEAAADYSISAVGWVDLRDEGSWDEDLLQDPFTYPQMKKLRQILGYHSNDPG